MQIKPGLSNTTLERILHRHHFVGATNQDVANTRYSEDGTVMVFRKFANS
jgi:hypothetical protein